MDAVELVNKLSNSPIVQSEVSLQMQLGLPWLSIKNGELCVRFHPHREEYRDGKMQFFAPLYEIEWVYPFAHIILFRNLKYEDQIDTESPLYEVNGDWMLGIGKYYTKELYKECSEVLTFREKHGTVNDIVVSKYQNLYQTAVERLGLEKLYL